MNTNKKPNDFRINDIDNDGSTIERIYYKSLNYVVYRTKNAIRIDFDDDCQSLSEFTSNHYKLGVQLARIYSWLPESLSWSEPINRQIARAIVVNVQGRADDAEKMLDHAEVRIIKLKTIQGRLEYTISSFIVVFALWLLLIIFQHPCLQSNAIYAAVALCGAIGGVLSVTLGYASLEIDTDANKWTNCLIGASRILISVAAALFIYFAISSEVALAFLGKMKSLDGIYLAAMTAGFSERLVPNIMANVSHGVRARDFGEDA